ncbi:DUF748 domain-containing protein [Crenobacter cavernae]|uniref:DUF748 domain-containing protein n=1 Tax=Crenobacter cavernae TaxID=2290923 RepID=A0A345Y749_9NEIS|nr:DUF748 domain-containing protein [Crenobacter cavernae]AXK39751.1 DUF748 domain-containing protein [Crenobacter cavernae]
MNDTPSSTPAPPAHRRRRWPYVLATLLLLWLAALGVAARFAPGWIRQAAGDWAAEHGRTLTLGDISLSPWSMTLAVGDVHFADRDGRVLFKAAKVEIDAEPTSLLIGRYHAAALTLTSPETQLYRDRNGLWNWAKLASDLAGKAPPKEESELPKIAVDRLEVKDGRFTFVDETTPGTPPWQLSPLNLVLNDLTTLPAEGGYTLNAEVDGGARLAWKGAMTLQPLTSRGRIEITGMTLKRLAPALHDVAKLPDPAGMLSVKADYRFSLTGADVRLVASPFNAELKDVTLSAPQSPSRLTLKTLAVENGSLDLENRRVDIGRVRLADGSLAALRAADGTLDWQAVVPPARKIAAEKAPGAPWSLHLARVSVENIALALSDSGFARPIRYQGTLAEAGLAFDQDAGKAPVVSKIAVHLSDNLIADSGGKPLATLLDARLKDASADVDKRSIALGTLTLAAPRIEVTRDKRGRIALADAFAPARRTGPAPAKDATPAWKVIPPILDVEQGRLVWRDSSTARPVEVAIDDIGGHGSAHDDGSLSVDLAGRAGSGRAVARVEVAPNGALDAKLSLAGLPLAPFAPYALSGTPLRLGGGAIGADIAVKAAAGNWHAAGSARLTQLSLLEPGERRPLVAWRELVASGMTASGGPRLAINVAELRLDGAQARLILDEKRQLNIARLFGAKPPKPQAAPAQGEDAPAGAELWCAKPAPAPSLPAVNVKTVVVRGSELDFADLGMRPNFATRIHGLKGTINGLSTQPGRRGTVTLDGNVDRYGDAKVRGTLAPLSPTDDTDITLAFRNIPITSLNPYSMNFAGWRIDDGRLSTDLRYHLVNRQLKGENRVVINSIKLGEEVHDPDVTPLPLRLAVALLEDSDGIIDLNLPIEGSLDEPKFSYGHLVWQAIRNVIVKVVTAPFRALASLFGGEGFDAINFAPGEAGIAPPEREKLDKLAQVLEKRPRVKVSLAGGVDVGKETRELARARADRAILVAAGLKPAPDLPLPLPDLEDARIQGAVKTVYGREVGLIKFAARLVATPDNRDRYVRLRDEIIAAQKVDAAALRALARARGDAAYKALIGRNAALKDRVTLAEPQTVKADAEGVPLVVKLDATAAEPGSANVPATAGATPAK